MSDIDLIKHARRVVERHGMTQSTILIDNLADALESTTARLREAERQRDAAEKQVEIRSKDSIAARIARSHVRAVEEWAATQALVANQQRYIEELEQVDSVGLTARLREAEAVIDAVADELERLERACVAVPSKKFFRTIVAAYKTTKTEGES